MNASSKPANTPLEIPNNVHGLPKETGLTTAAPVSKTTAQCRSKRNEVNASPHAYRRWPNSTYVHHQQHDKFVHQPFSARALLLLAHKLGRIQVIRNSYYLHLLKDEQDVAKTLSCNVYISTLRWCTYPSKGQASLLRIALSFAE